MKRSVFYCNLSLICSHSEKLLIQKVEIECVNRGIEGADPQILTVSETQLSKQSEQFACYPHTPPPMYALTEAAWEAYLAIRVCITLRIVRISHHFEVY